MPALVPRAEDLLMSWVWPQPSRSSQSNGAQEWTIPIQWERDAVMTRAVPVECGRPFWHPARRANTPQAKQSVERMCCAQPGQLQLLAVRRVVKHHQLMQLFQDNQQSLQQDAQEEKIKNHMPLTQKCWKLCELRMRQPGLDLLAC